jgi:hypothetical protein
MWAGLSGPSGRGHSGWVEVEVTANAAAADVTLDQDQLDALTALPAGKDS